MNWLAVGSVSGLIAVAMGAFGAHGLSGMLGAKALGIYQTAAQYQMYHSLALVALGVWAATHPGSAVGVPGWAFTLGIVIFSGSLYALALTDIKILGAITPIGGVLLMVGWASLAMLALRS